MLTDEQKKEVKEIIDTKGADLIEDRETAKEDLDILAKSVKDSYDISPTKFKKACEVSYFNNLEEEKMKALDKFSLCDELFEEGEE